MYHQGTPAKHASILSMASELSSASASPIGTRLEGEVTHYNSINDLYTIKYQNGKTDKFDIAEMKGHYKNF